MKKAGITMIAIGLVLLVIGLLLPAEAGEDKDFIRTAVVLQESAEERDPTQGEILQQTTQNEDLLKDRLMVKGKHLMTAGLAVSLAGFVVLILGVGASKNLD